MQATDEDLLAWYPTLSDVSPIVRADMLASALQFLAPSVWGGKLRQGHIHLTAHMLFMHQSAADGGANTGGPVASMSMGPVSTSYATRSDEEFAETSAGRAYISIRNSLGCMAFAVNRCL